MVDILTARFLTVVFLTGTGLVGAALTVLAWHRGRTLQTGSIPAPPGQEANRWLRWVGRLAVIPFLGLIGAHSYWALWVAGPLGEHPVFLQHQRRDARLRRIEESGLRGWIYDRHRMVGTSLAGYKFRGDDMVRSYPLGQDAVHVVGYSSLLRSRSGAELAYDDRLRSSLSGWNPLARQELVGEDLTLTLDRELQRVAAHQLRLSGLPGAVVVIHVRTGDVIAMASSPSFDPQGIDQDDTWDRLRNDPAQPFLNRALNQYYLPGSTFKVVVAAAALAQGLRNPVFICTSRGFRPGGTSQPIFDDRGPAEVHGRIGLAEALRVSCNQYFAQLGVKLGYQSLADTARGFGFHIDETPEESRMRRFDSSLWANTDSAFTRVFNPNASRLVLSRKTTAVDLAFQAYGQGFVQVTPFHMAQVVHAIANNGRLVTARLDNLHKSRFLAQAVAPDMAEVLRIMMIEVAHHPGGTAFRAFAGPRSRGLRIGGKTGTAQFAMLDEHRIDSWFIGFSPADDPQIAFAIVVEGGGYGSEKAAPMAAILVEAARDMRIDRNPADRGEAAQ